MATLQHEWHFLKPEVLELPEVMRSAPKRRTFSTKSRRQESQGSRGEHKTRRPETLAANCHTNHYYELVYVFRKCHSLQHDAVSQIAPTACPWRVSGVTEQQSRASPTESRAGLTLYPSNPREVRHAIRSQHKQVFGVPSAKSQYESSTCCEVKVGAPSNRWAASDSSGAQASVLFVCQLCGVTIPPCSVAARVVASRRPKQ